MKTRRNALPWQQVVWLVLSLSALLVACAPTRTVTETINLAHSTTAVATSTATVPPPPALVYVLGGLNATDTTGTSIDAHDAKTGALVWSKSFPDLTTFQGAYRIYGSTIFMSAETRGSSGAGQPVALALNALTGSVIWRVLPGTFAANGCVSGFEPPLVSATDVLLVILSAPNPACPSAPLIDLDPAIGKLRWSANLPTGFLYMGETAGLVLAEDGNDNVLALNAQTGAYAWERGFGPPGNVVAFSGNVLIVTTEPGNSSTTVTTHGPMTTLTVFDLASGHRLWSALFGFDQSHDVRYVVDGTLILVTDTSALSAYGLLSGKLLWKNSGGNRRIESIGNGIVLVTSATSTDLVGIREQDGTNLWTLSLMGLHADNTPLFGSGVAAKMVFLTFGAMNAVTLRAFDLQTGMLLWQSPLPGEYPGGMAEVGSGEIVTSSGVLHYVVPGASEKYCALTTLAVSERNGALLWSLNQPVQIPPIRLGC